jgi:S-formylglutathione hydrolase FrmB
MGGYGAFKLALSHPERFAAGASLSGALDLSVNRNKMPDYVADEAAEAWLRVGRNMFGVLDNFDGSANDLFYLAQEMAVSDGPQPRLFQCCGTEDFLYDQNQRFLELARSLNLDLTYEEGPGEHEWGYWDTMIQRVLAWLPLEKMA